MNPTKTFPEFIYDSVMEKESKNVFLANSDNLVVVNTNDGFIWKFEFVEGELDIENVNVYMQDKPDDNSFRAFAIQAAWELYTE